MTCSFVRMVKVGREVVSSRGLQDDPWIRRITMLDHSTSISIASQVPSRVEDISRQTIHGWFVIGFSRSVPREGNRLIRYWKVRCVDCGQEREFQSANLKGNRAAHCDHIWPRTIDQLQPPHYMLLPGYSGYIVGDDGSVWSCHISGGAGGLSDQWRQRDFRSDKDGYQTIALKRDGKTITRRVAHCVLEAFVGPCPEGMESCHYPDPDPKNNRRDNLRWGTHRSNIADKVAINSQAKGEQHGRSKLVAEQIMIIRQMDLECVHPRVIREMFGISNVYLHAIVIGKNWKHLPVLYGGDRQIRECPKCGICMSTRHGKIYIHVEGCKGVPNGS